MVGTSPYPVVALWRRAGRPARCADRACCRGAAAACTSCCCCGARGSAAAVHVVQVHAVLAVQLLRCTSCGRFSTLDRPRHFSKLIRV